jgi:hypothetical protein
MTYVVGHDEQISYGPSALRIAPDGTLWIVNPADNTLTNIHPDGRVGNQFRIDETVAVTDVTFRPDGTLEALDTSALSPMAITISATGTITNRRSIENKLSAGQARAPAAAQSKSSAFPASTPDSTISERVGRWTLLAGTDESPDGTIVSASGRITVRAGRGVIRGLQILSDESDSVVLLVEEVGGADTIIVDATVRRYTLSGELLGVGRIPLAEQYTWVEHPVAVSDTGEVYVLETKPGYAAIEPLVLSRSVPDILPAKQGKSPSAFALAVPHTEATTPAISRTQIRTNALAFLNNSTYYKQSALTGACSGREIPSYLAGMPPGTYGSVPYAWGHGDSVVDFNAAIASSYQAGDTDKNNDLKVLTCARGVDCSGYVTRVWGLPATVKLGTCDLSGNTGYTFAIPDSVLATGDILVLCGTHVVMIDSVSASGLYVFESTNNNNANRVTYNLASWSRFANYSRRRYYGLTVTAATPVPVSLTATPISGAVGMLATFASTWKVNDAWPLTAKLTVRAPSGATVDYPMTFVSGYYATGANFQVVLKLLAAGRYDWAVTATAQTTGWNARYPSSGYIVGPTVK